RIALQQHGANGFFDELALVVARSNDRDSRPGCPVSTQGRKQWRFDSPGPAGLSGRRWRQLSKGWRAHKSTASMILITSDHRHREDNSPAQVLMPALLITIGRFARHERSSLVVSNERIAAHGRAGCQKVSSAAMANKTEAM